MILADKIINLRKKCGYSQEELAYKMNVSRQAVSKWESAQSIPDLDKVLMLSKIFGVSTDFLLKDELELQDFVPSEDLVENEKEKVTMGMATEFINIKFVTARYIAVGVLLCVLSPVTLILLGGLSAIYQLNPNLMCIIGLITLFVFVAIAVSLFIYSGYKVNKYDFLSNEVFETEYGVNGMVKEKKNQLKDSYFKYNLFGVLLCIIGIIPLLIGAFSDKGLFVIVGVALLIILVAIATFLFVLVGCKMGALDRLLQEGEYTKERKKQNPVIGGIASLYWMIATAIYLLWSFQTNDWDKTWIVWPVSGVLYAGIGSLLYALNSNKK